MARYFKDKLFGVMVFIFVSYTFSNENLTQNGLVHNTDQQYRAEYNQQTAWANSSRSNITLLVLLATASFQNENQNDIPKNTDLNLTLTEPKNLMARFKSKVAQEYFDWKYVSINESQQIDEETKEQLSDATNHENDLNDPSDDYDELAVAKLRSILGIETNSISYNTDTPLANHTIELQDSERSEPKANTEIGDDHILTNNTESNSNTPPLIVTDFNEEVLVAQLKKNMERRLRDITNVMKNMWRNAAGQNEGWGLSTEEAWQVYKAYYKCVGDKYQELLHVEEGKIKPVHAVMALQGERVSLKCIVCTRPDVEQGAVWQYLRRSDSSIGLLRLGTRISVDPSGSLIITDLQYDDAGQYNCLDSNHEYAAIYQVDVRFRERRVLVKDGEPVMNVTYLPDHNLQIFTQWSPWGDCDTCDVTGSRQRHGTCTVQKINDSDPVYPKDFPLLQHYPDGLPCHSTALPVRIRGLHEVRARREETLVGTCHVSCPTEPPPLVVTDKEGKTIEVIPANERFYDLGEKPPEVKSVQRRVLFEPEGKHLVLQCSDIEREAGVRWMRGKRRIDPSSIQRQTQGRVWVDSANRLHIGLLLLSDTAVYNCWERERHVVAIKILVVDAFNEKLKEYITYGGFGATIFASLVACCCLVGRGQKKKTAQ